MDRLKYDKRPIGLIIFALINFIIAGFGYYGLILLLISKNIQQPVSLSNYFTLLVTSTLLLISGIGIIKLQRRFGYTLGCFVWVGPLARLIDHYAILLKYNAQFNFYYNFIEWIPAFIYPIILLMFLKFRYKKYFK